MKKNLSFKITAVMLLFSLLSLVSCMTSPVPVSTYDAKLIEILNSNETVDEFGARIIHTEIRNNSDKLCSGITIKSIYYDANQTMVGTGAGIGMNIPAHQTKIIDIAAIDIQNAVKYTLQVDAAMFE